MRPSVSRAASPPLRVTTHSFCSQPDEASVLEMDIRNDLYTFRPMKRDEVLKRRVSETMTLSIAARSSCLGKHRSDCHAVFQLEYLHQALTNRVRTKSSQTHQRFFLSPPRVVSLSICILPASRSMLLILLLCVTEQ